MATSKNDDKNKVTAKDVELVRSKVPQIVVPEAMKLEEVIEWCYRKQEEEEKEVAIYHELPYSPIDGMAAFQKALSRIYGWVDMVSSGWDLPTMVGITVGLNKIVQVPWGKFKVPTISGWLETGMKSNMFIINGKIKRKHEKEVNAIVEKTLEILKDESIYKSQAIKVSFEWERNEDYFNPLNHCPKFIDLSGVDEEDMVFSSVIRNSLDIALFYPIEYSQACREARIPLKRGVLLSGKYGVGKSMCSNVAAKKAIQNGWTFIYLESVQDLKRGLQFAAQYAPAILFAEDVDRAITGNRTYSMDELLNILDGVDTKGKEIITVFTTNHLSDINVALKRPGRLDSIINIEPPDADAAAKIIGRYARGLLVPGADLTEVGRAVAGYIPAIIREVVERAKIAAIGRSKGGNIENSITTNDLLKAADSMKEHVKLLEENGTKKKYNPELLVRIPEGYTSRTRDLLDDLGMTEEEESYN